MEDCGVGNFQRPALATEGEGHTSALAKNWVKLKRRGKDMDNLDTRLNLAQVLAKEMQALGRTVPEVKLTSTDAATREWRSEGLDAVRTEILEEQKKNKPLTALCFSGGGIRSATFCLGVLQRLAKLELLSKFDYLSTVSGGGFIGAWLKAWAMHGKQGMAGVEKQINGTDEPAPIRYLRYFSNYLSPRFSLLSADTWSIVSTYLRNLLLNWLVLIPLLMLPLLVPMMYLAFQGVIGRIEISHWALFAIGVLALGYAVVRLRQGLPSAAKRGFSQGQFLGHCLVPLVVAVTALTLWWQQIHANPEWVKGLNFWAYCPWLSQKIAPDSLFDFSSLLGVTVIFYFAAFLAGKIYNACCDRAARAAASVYAKWWKELAALLATAVVAAGLTWCWTQAFPVGRDRLIYACLAIPALLAVFTLSEVFYIGVASYFTDDMDREFWAHAGAWDLIVMVGWIVMSALALYGPILIEDLGPMVRGIVFGTGAAAGGFAAKFGHSALTKALAGADGKPSLASKWLSKLALPLALLVFAVVLMAFLAYLAVAFLPIIGYWLKQAALLYRFADVLWLVPEDGRWIDPFLALRGPKAILTTTPLGLVTIAFLLLALLQWAMGRVIHVNKFSLHAAYRNRIMRAYLGASRGKEREPNLFTGFDPRDNIDMKDMASVPVERPLQVVNIALNLVRGENLAWQERKASSFTASAYHCGGYDVGYRPTEIYGGGKGMTLGTAITISGAAFTPNAGYHSSPLLTFVMSCFNVRLGWWLGNPRHKTAKEPGPKHAAAPLIAETFGLTDDSHDWVYLSDGGHFENLGLYEMAARRVRQIIVIDASADPKYEFEDLGNAIRKIRADFGISIERDGPMKIARRFTDGAYCTTFRIRYSDVHVIPGLAKDDIDGELLYIKPALNGSEPQDVAQYATTSDDFPHETTADQFFTESQFESYRALGMHELDKVISGAAAKSPKDLIECGRRHSQAAKP